MGDAKDALRVRASVAPPSDLRRAHADQGLGMGAVQGDQGKLHRQRGHVAASRHDARHALEAQRDLHSCALACFACQMSPSIEK